MREYQWNACSFSRCVYQDSMKQCVSGPIASPPKVNGAQIERTDVDQLTVFESLTLELTTARPSIVTPLVADVTTLKPIGVADEQVCNSREPLRASPLPPRFRPLSLLPAPI